MAVLYGASSSLFSSNLSKGQIFNLVTKNEELLVNLLLELDQQS